MLVEHIQTGGWRLPDGVRPVASLEFDLCMLMCQNPSLVLLKWGWSGIRILGKAGVFLFRMLKGKFNCVFYPLKEGHLTSTTTYFFTLEVVL